MVSRLRKTFYAMKILCLSMYLYKPAVIEYLHNAEGMVVTLDLVWHSHQYHTAHRFRRGGNT